MEENRVIECQVGKELLDIVERESCQILLQQRVKFNNRWYSSGFFVMSTSLLRIAGILFSFLGMFLCIFYLVYPSSCPKWFYAEVYLLLFIIFAIVFWYMPLIEEKIKARLKIVGEGGSRRLARRLVKKARKCVPYTAEYSIKGDLVSYSRKVNGQGRTVWSRRLKGFAIIDKHTLLLFRKPTSLVPVMLILFDENIELSNVLKQLGIAFEEMV